MKKQSILILILFSLGNIIYGQTKELVSNDEAKGYLVDGIKDGLWTFYYDNGKPKIEVYYDSGTPYGDYLGYYEDGSKKDSGFVKNCFRVGDWKVWTKDGRGYKGIIDNSNSHNQKKNENFFTTDEIESKKFVYDWTTKIDYGKAKKLHELGASIDESVLMSQVSGGKYVKTFADIMEGCDKYQYFEGFYEASEGIYNGVHLKFNKNMDIISEGGFENGKPIEKWTEYYDNGNLKSEKKYNSSGNLIGTNLNYYENGNLESSINYDRWDDPQRRREYNERDKKTKRNGPYKKYFKNGDVAEEGFYTDNWPTGKWTYWYKNGNKMKEGESGKMCTVWYENGNKKLESIFIRRSNDYVTNPMGNSFYFRSLMDKYKSINGEPNGKYTSWYENGDLKLETHFERGIYNGPYTYWGENGVKIMEGNIVPSNDCGNCYKRDGLWTLYNENGDKIVEGTLPTGTWNYWYDNGKKKTQGFGGNSNYESDDRVRIRKNLFPEIQPYNNKNSSDGKGNWMFWDIEGNEYSGKINISYNRQKDPEGPFLVYPSSDFDGVFESFYEKDSENGLVVRFYPNGQTQSKYNLRFGDKNGFCVFWHENGEIDLDKSGTYKNGRKIEDFDEQKYNEEQKRKTEEKKLVEEKRMAEEKRIAEEQRIAEEKKLELISSLKGEITLSNGTSLIGECKSIKDGKIYFTVHPNKKIDKNAKKKRKWNIEGRMLKAKLIEIKNEESITLNLYGSHYPLPFEKLSKSDKDFLLPVTLGKSKIVSIPIIELSGKERELLFEYIE